MLLRERRFNRPNRYTNWVPILNKPKGLIFVTVSGVGDQYWNDQLTLQPQFGLIVKSPET